MTLFRTSLWTLCCCGLIAACAGPVSHSPGGETLYPQPDKSIISTASAHPTLADFWRGEAHFEIDVVDTGLPLGESDTLVMENGDLWSFIHASRQSAGIVDQCGDPVEFPGCVVIMESQDEGRTFTPQTAISGEEDKTLTCQIPCRQCPCTSKEDQIDQQQYPQIARRRDGKGATDWIMVYEYRANNMMRRSTDGLNWSPAEELPLTGIWNEWLMPCREEERIGPHPNAGAPYDCLVGSPPGITLAEGADAPGEAEVYIFVGLGQNPGSMGCYRGEPGAPAATFRKCAQNPLFTGAASYGPLEATGAAANPHFDFRTISSADVITVDDRHYMLYEGVRGPAPGAAGDTQFGLGLARSLTGQIDGPWETFPGNPILVDVPANVGLGHADLIIINGQTALYTSLDGEVRSRLVLVD